MTYEIIVDSESVPYPVGGECPIGGGCDESGRFIHKGNVYCWHNVPKRACPDGCCVVGYDTDYPPPEEWDYDRPVFSRPMIELLAPGDVDVGAMWVWHPRDANDMAEYVAAVEREFFNALRADAKSVRPPPYDWTIQTGR